MTSKFVNYEQKKLNQFSSLKLLQILNAMSLKDEYMSISKISQITGLSQSTTHRILNDMVLCNYVIKNHSLKMYKIGVGMLTLASRLMASNSITTASREEMTKLNKITTETIHLVSLDGMEAVYIDKMDTRHSIGLMSRIGKKIPLYCTSAGKAILAFKDEEWINEYIDTIKRERYTAKTLVDEIELRKELMHVKECGYALDNEEHHDNIICIGAPIFSSPDEPIASISIAAPAYRLPVEKAIEYSSLLVESAKLISIRIGNAIG